MSIVAQYTSSSLQSSGHVNGEGNRNDHTILRPGSHGSSRLGFHGLCALFIGVKFVVLASFWGLIFKCFFGCFFLNRANPRKRKIHLFLLCRMQTGFFFFANN